MGSSDLASELVKIGVFLTSDRASVASIALFATLLCACIVVGHLLEESRWLNESITAIVIGLCSGVIILLTTKGRSSHILVFSEDLFFIYLLPPIIFNAGFQVKKKQFFHNFMMIMLFGALGTLISFFIISFGAITFFKRLGLQMAEIGDYLAIGAIFSATDSVCTLQVLSQNETPFLYSLVFGEGVVNDATSVVLFNAIQSLDLAHIGTTVAFQFVGNFLYLFLTSTFLGVFAGLLSAYIIKRLYFGRHSTDREVALMMLMAYLFYLLADLFYMSGILTVFFCGVVMSHYTWHNVTESSRITTKHAFATMSFIAEVFIFLYVGMDALDIEKWRFISDSLGKSGGVSATILGLVLVGRAAFVFPLSFLSNFLKKNINDRICFKQQVCSLFCQTSYKPGIMSKYLQIIIWWAGLMRGAVSMALAYKQFTASGHTELHENAIMITSTISVVLFSTTVFGLMTKPLMRLLLPSSSTPIKSSCEPSSPRSYLSPFLDHGYSSDNDFSGGSHGLVRPTSLRMLLAAPTHTVHHYWRRFDDAFMRPMFGGRGFVPFVPGTPIDRSAHGLCQEEY